MRAAILIFFLTLCTISCKNRNKVPGNILPATKMQALLWDIMRADKFVTDFLLVSDTSLNRNRESIKLYQQVLALHSVSKEEFRKSFYWYQDHPAVLKVIMDSLNNRRGQAPTEMVRPTDSAGRSTRDSFPLDSNALQKRRKLLKPD